MNQRNRITILYVDDEKDNLVVFKANFDRKFHVITSISPISAFNELDRHHNEIIVVLSDMRMPVMNGVEFVRKAQAKYNDIYYCILTGYGYDDQVQRAMEDNIIYAFFQKPFNPKEIESTILKVAEKRI
ncbi:response regulator [Marinoscillum sp. MHG1-6]|uniref:response regulator n=1 Tax=Marinoscillum sp. MHG1-6 TaxID=2959627 RepID=UPI00215884C0|nr:response regulator [Marinoscillum sp. MHG1-6]